MTRLTKKLSQLETIRKGINDGLNYSEISKEIGLSRERVRQLVRDNFKDTYKKNSEKWAKIKETKTCDYCGKTIVGVRKTNYGRMCPECYSVKIKDIKTH